MRSRSFFFGAALVWASTPSTACFSPDAVAGSETTADGQTGSDDETTANATTDGTTWSATDGVTITTSTTTESETTSSTGSTPECVEPDLGCLDGEYCADGTCESPPDGMVGVPAGPFMMGCNEELDSECDDDEFPYHEVTLNAFAIDRYEVTVQEYEGCVQAGDCTTPAYEHAACLGGPGYESYPINCVSWIQAQGYCSVLGKRLPTEAEWEKAARGTDGRVYPWGNEPPSCALAVMEGCQDPPAVGQVGSKPAGASPYGVLDVAGNLYEHVFDWYAPAYYLESPAEDPTGPSEGQVHSARGGTFQYGGAARNMRASDRGASDAVSGGVLLLETQGAVGVGFRCVADP